MVNKAVDEYWIEHIKKMSTYFKSLGYMKAVSILTTIFNKLL